MRAPLTSEAKNLTSQLVCGKGLQGLECKHDNAQCKGTIWEVLNGVGVDGVGYSFHFSCRSFKGQHVYGQHDP